jgi:hypothetical protein
MAARYTQRNTRSSVAILLWVLSGLISLGGGLRGAYYHHWPTAILESAMGAGAFVVVGAQYANRIRRRATL